MQRLFLTVALSLAIIATVIAQTRTDAVLKSQLERLFPEAAGFSPKEGNPPHYKVFAPGNTGGEPQLMGFAFWTTELEPLERGFDGPIKMLVGMDAKGALAGVIVTDHREPYGDFSIEIPSFAEQYVHKDIRDRFRVGEDVDAVTRATITVTSASRAIRNSSRRIARALLAPPDP